MWERCSHVAIGRLVCFTWLDYKVAKKRKFDLAVVSSRKNARVSLNLKLCQKKLKLEE